MGALSKREILRIEYIPPIVTVFLFPYYSNIKENDDKFGTLKANKVMNSMRQERLDYRETSNKKSDIGGFGLVGGGNGSTLPNDDLIITDELLTLLEDFQKKNYSAKEMEMLFESWKRKGIKRKLP